VIDLPSTYSINIVGYDPQTLYSPSENRRLKGKMSVNYDDRTGVYKLVSTDISKTDNVSVLSYKAGDKLCFRNTADPTKDYALLNGFKYYMSTFLYKRPSNLPFIANVNDGGSAVLFEWKSNEFGPYNQHPYILDSRVSPTTEYPFTTIMNLKVEEGFNYYLLRMFFEPSVTVGGTPFMLGTFYGDDYNDFNRLYGVGQTFKLLSGHDLTPNDYKPNTYTPPELGVV
jgi:hypothetical protein